MNTGKPYWQLISRVKFELEVKHCSYVAYGEDNLRRRLKVETVLGAYRVLSDSLAYHFYSDSLPLRRQ